MAFYAQIDENNRVIGITDAGGGTIDDPSVEEIETYDISLLGKFYDRKTKAFHAAIHIATLDESELTIAGITDVSEIDPRARAKGIITLTDEQMNIVQVGISRLVEGEIINPPSEQEQLWAKIESIESMLNAIMAHLKIGE